jgi:hypothetical protein
MEQLGLLREALLHPRSIEASNSDEIPSRVLDAEKLCDKLAELRAEVAELRELSRSCKELLLMRDEALSGLQISSLSAHSHKKVTVDARFPLREEDGFYELEYDGTGKHYRWTGPQNYFRFSLMLQRTTDLSGEITIPSAALPENLQRLSCFVDGDELPLVAQPGTKHVFHFMLPANPEITITQLYFFVGQVIRPCDYLPNSSDTRKLGVTFRQIKIFPASLPEPGQAS